MPNIEFNQGNSFQPDALHRCFVGSPLRGNSQGLAICLNGVPFNQPFGSDLRLITGGCTPTSLEGLTVVSFIWR